MQLRFSGQSRPPLLQGRLGPGLSRAQLRLWPPKGSWASRSLTWGLSCLWKNSCSVFHAEVGTGSHGARLRLWDLSAGPGRPEMGGGCAGGWKQAARGPAGSQVAMGKPSLPAWAEREESQVSFLSVLGGLPSSETHQRPGSQRPCFRQVGSSDTALSLSFSGVFLLSDSSTGDGVRREGQGPTARA